MGSEEKKHRIQFDLSSKAMARLEAIKSQTEAVSYAEVVKNAIRLYEALIRAEQEGNTFYVMAKDGRHTAYKIFI